MSDTESCQVCGSAPETGYVFPLCPRCRTILASRPYPRWIYLAGAAVLVILTIALSQSPRTLRAGIAFERGQAYEAKGAYGMAVNEYRRVTEAFPNSTLVLARLAITLRKGGHVPEAEVILQRLGGRQASQELVQEVNQTVEDLSKQREVLSQGIEQKKVSVGALETRLHDLDQDLGALNEQLRSLKATTAEMEDQASKGMAIDEQEYHRLIAQHNSIVGRYNSELSTRNTLYAQYEAQLKEVNALIDQYNRSISPKAGSIP